MLLVYLLTHFFLPHHTNNQKAKILHSTTILILTLYLVLTQVTLQLVPYSGLRILGYAANISSDRVISLTNEKRVEKGLAPLVENPQLSSAALSKGVDMIENDYWAHVSPNGTQPWKFFIDEGYKYKYAGENLARDFKNPESAIEAWLASPSHRENMLSAKYKEVGIAVVEGDLDGVDTTIIVQLFGTKLIDTVPSLPIARAETTLVPEESPFPSPTSVASSTPLPSQSEEKVLTSPSKSDRTSDKISLLISPFDATRNISLITVALLLIVLVVDAILTSRRKIARIGGRTFAHMAFLGMILAIVIIAKAGLIL